MLEHVPPPATRDSPPEEMAARRRLEAAFASAAQSYGFSEVATPTFERADLFGARSGREIKNSLLTFHCDHEEYALRPEMTAPVCRMVASGALDRLPGPHRLYYVAPCFRYCRPHSGGRREFTQAGIEVLGDAHLRADAEVIAAGHRFLTSAGARHLSVKVGTAGVFGSLLPSDLGSDDTAAVIGHLDRLAAIRERCAEAIAGRDVLLEEQLRADRRDLATVQMQCGYAGRHAIAGRPLSEGRAVAEVLVAEATDTYRYLWTAEGYMPDETADQLLETSAIQGAPGEVDRKASEVLAGTPALGAVTDLLTLCALLRHYGIESVKITLGIGRGLNFYTGPVFEIASGAAKLCGGGRYDGLVELFGGPPTPATGCAVRLDSLRDLGYGDSEAAAADGIRVVGATGSDEASAIRLSEALRDRGVLVGAPGAPVWTVDGSAVRAPGGDLMEATTGAVVETLRQGRGAVQLSRVTP